MSVYKMELFVSDNLNYMSSILVKVPAAACLQCCRQRGLRLAKPNLLLSKPNRQTLHTTPSCTSVYMDSHLDALGQYQYSVNLLPGVAEP
jgi:hypothetical protein